MESTKQPLSVQTQCLVQSCYIKKSLPLFHGSLRKNILFYTRYSLNQFAVQAMVNMAPGHGRWTVSIIGWVTCGRTIGGQGAIPPPLCNMDVVWRSGTSTDPPKL
ncbi:hypothetical protein KIL84_011568 [Mauremys mutica]|uniref:Uncharacterized protein n=1 Tax=Mauremys mutica TaxID=74926 RepID=A0A9D3XDX4_9SAUR|nr:hypothetical protein KIL84_011568 [Mauremys mutica]